jgi:hypothetical protein
MKPMKPTLQLAAAHSLPQVLPFVKDKRRVSV